MNVPCKNSVSIVFNDKITDNAPDKIGNNKTKKHHKSDLHIAAIFLFVTFSLFLNLVNWELSLQQTESFCLLILKYLQISVLTHR